jgi:hypothetical protein
VKNTSAALIGRLRIAETWYDDAGNLIPGGDAVVNGLLQPGEITTLEIRACQSEDEDQHDAVHARQRRRPEAARREVARQPAAAKEPAAKTAAATKAAPKKQ